LSRWPCGCTQAGTIPNQRSLASGTLSWTGYNDTQDQDEVIAKAKGKTLEDAREDMEILRAYIHDLAEDAHQIQPADPHKE
jgi:hypothetical protein